MSEKPRVLVTRRWPQAVETQLAKRFDVEFNEADRPLTAAQLRAALNVYDAVLPTVTDPITAEVLDVPAPRTRIIGNYGVGFSHIDIEAARSRGIVVTNTPDVLSDCTADIAMTLMLMAARRAGEGERELRAGEWTGWRPTHLVGAKVSGKTLGLVGFGRIAQEVAKRAHHGFGMKILIFNRSPVASAVLAHFGARQVASLDELLPQVDFLSLHCPGGDATRGLIGAREMARMKSGAFLINTARGEVIDDAALCESLKSGHLGGAGLDVFEGEPDLNPDLLDAPGLTLLPHLGSATRETREAMGMRVFDNISDYFEGREPRDRVA